MKRDEFFKTIRSIRESKATIYPLGIESEFGEILYDFVIEHKLNRIVETGVHHGFSSWYFLEALKITDGHLWSIEPNIKDQMIVPSSLRDHWNLIKGVSPHDLYDLLTELDKVDLFFHDSDHTYSIQFGEYVMASKHCKFIASHDIRRTGAWLAFLDLYRWEEIISKRKFGVAIKA